MSGTDYTRTPNYQLYKPVANADEDVWGDHWNANADTLDALIKTVENKAGVSTFNARSGAVTLQALDINTAGGLLVAGGTMTGPLVLAGNASAPLNPVSLQQLQTGYLPLGGGTLTGPLTLAGNASSALQPVALQQMNAAIAGFAPLASPVFTGDPQAPRPGPTDNDFSIATTGWVHDAIAAAPSLTIADTPPPSPGLGALWWDSVGTQLYLWYNDGTSSQWVPANNYNTGSVPEAPTDGKQYARQNAAWSQVAAAGGASITVSDTPPASPTPGALWWDSVNTGLYLYYNDGNSSQWVIANNQATLPEAPQDAKTYARRNAAWVDTAPLSMPGNVGRNVLHNPLFAVQQRGAGGWGVGGYTADRWRVDIQSTSGGCNTTIQPLTAATAATVGDEWFKYFLQMNSTMALGPTGAGDFCLLRQFVEDTRRLSGKTVTISFWAWASSGTPKVCVECFQTFGTGGSPSPGVSTVATPTTLSTTATRYSVTLTLPSVAGKTFGTNANTDWTEVNFWVSGGATYTARSGGIGFQTNTFCFWGMQLEIGSVATPLDYGGSPQQQLAQCQRFYTTGQIYFGGYSNGTVTAVQTITLPVPLRSLTPTITITTNSDAAITSPGQAMMSGSLIYFQGQTPATSSGWAINRFFTISADL